MRIVVTTPTGHVGSRVVRLLVQAGLRPTVLVRRASRAAPIVLMVRNYLVPVAAVLVLISQPGAWEGEGMRQSMSKT